MFIQKKDCHREATHLFPREKKHFYESFIHIIKRTHEDKSMINASGNNKLVK
jgi:hypothetical protein